MSCNLIDTEEPFLELLEGGRGGELHNDIVEYFYYCQLRTQSEESMEERNITGRIQIEEVPSLLRAVGYYPTEQEASDIINEVKSSAHFLLTCS